MNEKTIVFDIETENIFDAGSMNTDNLKISVVGAYNFRNNKYTAYTVDELDNLWKDIKDSQMLVGFNSNKFDIPILQRYADFDIKKEIKSIDILEEIKRSFGRRIKLDLIAKGTLGKGKSGHGLKAVDLWKEGKYEEVKKYCLDDVKITKEVYEYALKYGKLKFEDLGAIYEMTIDTSNWDVEEEENAETNPLF